MTIVRYISGLHSRSPEDVISLIKTFGRQAAASLLGIALYSIAPAQSLEWVHPGALDGYRALVGNFGLNARTDGDQVVVPVPRDGFRIFARENGRWSAQPVTLPLGKPLALKAFDGDTFFIGSKPMVSVSDSDGAESTQPLFYADDSTKFAAAIEGDIGAIFNERDNVLYILGRYDGVWRNDQKIRVDEAIGNHHKLDIRGGTIILDGQYLSTIYVRDDGNYQPIANLEGASAQGKAALSITGDSETHLVVLYELQGSGAEESRRFNIENTAGASLSDQVMTDRHIATLWYVRNTREHVLRVFELREARWEEVISETIDGAATLELEQQTLLVTQPELWNIWSEEGAMTVFDLADANYSKQQITAGSGPEFHFFGRDVRGSGDTFIVGALERAYIYSWPDLSKPARLQAILDPTEQFAHLGRMGFGDAVAIRGSRALVSGTRKAYLYERQGEHWGLLSELNEDTEATPAGSIGFASRLELGNSSVFIAAPDFLNSSSGYGAVFVYTGDGQVLHKVLRDDRQIPGTHFGSRLRYSQNRLVVAAKGTLGSVPGAVHIFDWGDGEWTQSATIEAPEMEDNLVFGESIDLLGDRLLIGSPPVEPRIAPGKFRLYEHQQGSWRLTATIENDLATAFGNNAVLAPHAIVVTEACGHLCEPHTPGFVHLFSEESGWAKDFSVSQPSAPSSLATLDNGVLVGLSNLDATAPYRRSTGAVRFVAPDDSNAPVAQPDIFRLEEDFKGTIDLFADNGAGRDFDPDGPFSLDSINWIRPDGWPEDRDYSSSFEPQSDGLVRIRPIDRLRSLRVDETQPMVLEYTIEDPRGRTSSTQAVIEFYGQDTRPLAQNDLVYTEEDVAAVEFDVTMNDSDPDGGETPVVASVSQPSYGTASILPSGQIRFEPPANFCTLPATISFEYSLEGGSTARIYIEVDCTNDAPDFLVARNPHIEELADTTVQLGGIVDHVSAGPGEDVVALPIFSNGDFGFPGYQWVSRFVVSAVNDPAGILRSADMDDAGILTLDITGVAGIAELGVKAVDNLDLESDVKTIRIGVGVDSTDVQAASRVTAAHGETVIHMTVANLSEHDSGNFTARISLTDALESLNWFCPSHLPCPPVGSTSYASTVRVAPGDTLSFQIRSETMVESNDALGQLRLELPHDTFDPNPANNVTSFRLESPRVFVDGFE